MLVRFRAAKSSRRVSERIFDAMCAAPIYLSWCCGARADIIPLYPLALSPLFFCLRFSCLTLLFLRSQECQEDDASMVLRYGMCLCIHALCTYCRKNKKKAKDAQKQRIKERTIRRKNDRERKREKESVDPGGPPVGVGVQCALCAARPPFFSVLLIRSFLPHTNTHIHIICIYTWGSKNSLHIHDKTTF